MISLSGSVFEADRLRGTDRFWFIERFVKLPVFRGEFLEKILRKELPVTWHWTSLLLVGTGGGSIADRSVRRFRPVRLPEFFKIWASYWNIDFKWCSRLDLLLTWGCEWPVILQGTTWPFTGLFPSDSAFGCRPKFGCLPDKLWEVFLDFIRRKFI